MEYTVTWNGWRRHTGTLFDCLGWLWRNAGNITIQAAVIEGWNIKSTKRRN